jgi:hypothetical protein
MDDVDLEKYKLLYEYQKDQFEKEIERFRRLEDKATKYLSSMTIAMGAYLFLARWAIENTIPPKGPIEWCVVISMISTFVAFMSSFSFFLRTTNLSGIVKMPADSALIDYFHENQRPTVLLGLSKKYADGVARMEESYEIKLGFVKKTYSEIVFTAWSLSISVAFIFIRQWSI